MMKKRYVAIIALLCAIFLAGCQEAANGEHAMNGSEETQSGNSGLLEAKVINDDENSEKTDDGSNLAVSEKEKIIEGYDFVDGKEVSVRIRIGIEDIQKGEEAYARLCEQNADTQSPGENEEYIIVTFNISYEEGEVEELFMFEDRASLEEAGLYFSLSNGESNAYDVTSYLANNIYNVSLLQGQSAQGAVAFLQEKGNVEPLYFVGFENMVEFSVN